MNKKILLIGIIFVVIAVVTAAAVLFLYPYEPKNPPKANDVNSTMQGVQEVVDANNQFAFDLYSQTIKSENGNVFYSPYSISAALAMTYEGANGKTADEMKSVLHFPQSDILRPNFASIYNNLNSKNDAFELRTGNALWAQQDYTFLPDYMVRVEKYYGGKAVNLDFVNETEQSRQTINSFIEEQTNNKITNLIPDGVLDANTRLVLTNAIYFKGTWEWEFDKSKTQDMNFKITPTNIVKTPMMFMEPNKAMFNYSDLGDLQIIELPYKGNELSMIILLPTENLSSIEKSLTMQKLAEYKSSMHETKLTAIYLPKFEFDTSYSMQDTLTSMGMPTAFDSQTADFSGMTGKTDLYIGAVIHKAFIKVDEQGTEAAAATAVVMTTGAAFGGPRSVFNADHPFIFIIQEKETGNILFMGRVTDPRV